MVSGFFIFFSLSNHLFRFFFLLLFVLLSAFGIEHSFFIRFSAIRNPWFQILYILETCPFERFMLCWFVTFFYRFTAILRRYDINAHYAHTHMSIICSVFGQRATTNTVLALNGVDLTFRTRVGLNDDHFLVDYIAYFNVVFFLTDLDTGYQDWWGMKTLYFLFDFHSISLLWFLNFHFSPVSNVWIIQFSHRFFLSFLLYIK